MATRRNFFKYLGLAGGVATGGVVAAAAVIPDSGKCEAIEKIQNNAKNGHLELQQIYSDNKDLSFHTNHQERYRISADGDWQINSFAYQPYQPRGKSVSVEMMPGPDGELYLKTNGKWRRIVTE